VPAWREVGRIVVPRTHRSPPRRQCRLGTARRHDWRRSADNHSSHLRCKSSRALRYPSGFGEWSCRDCVRCRISLWRRRSTSERRDRRRLHLLPGAGDRPFAEQVMMHAGITYLKFFMSRSPAILFVILGEVGVLLEDHEFAGEQGRVGDPVYASSIPVYASYFPVWTTREFYLQVIDFARSLFGPNGPNQNIPVHLPVRRENFNGFCEIARDRRRRLGPTSSM
jgi:hypothetical protein